MPVIFLLKITIIAQFKLTLCVHIYSHILDRSKHILFHLCIITPAYMWNKQPKSFFSLFSFPLFSISPYLSDSLVFSTFWRRDNCRSFSRIISSIHWNQGACVIGSILIKILFLKKVGKENKWTISNSKIFSLFLLKLLYFVFIILHSNIELM